MPEPLAAFLANKHRYDKTSSQALSVETRKCITRDGMRIGLYANMRPVGAARVRYALRGAYLHALEELAREAIACDSVDTVSRLVNEALRHMAPELREGAISV